MKISAIVRQRFGWIFYGVCLFLIKYTFCIQYMYEELLFITLYKGSLWSWPCGSWIYSYMCYQCLSPLKLPDRNPGGEVYSIQYYVIKVCQWLAMTTGEWFFPAKGTLAMVSSTNKTVSFITVLFYYLFIQLLTNTLLLKYCWTCTWC